MILALISIEIFNKIEIINRMRKIISMEEDIKVKLLNA